MIAVPIRNPVTDAVLFSQTELACRSDGVSMRFAQGFLDHLLDLRLTFGRPMKPNSCCRTPAHNKAEGGEDGSYHLTIGNASDGCCAMDVHVPNDSYRHLLMFKAQSAGWSVGVYRTFIHIDRRSDFGAPQIVFWGKP